MALEDEKRDAIGQLMFDDAIFQRRLIRAAAPVWTRRMAMKASPIKKEASHLDAL